VARTRAISPPQDRTGRSGLLLVGLAIILIFAVIGVVSAAVFLGSVVAAGSPHSPRVVSTGTTKPSTLQDVRRAQAQATKIVAQARTSGRANARQVTRRARAQATALVVAAKRRAGAIVAGASSAAAAPPAAAAPAPTYVAPSSSAGSGSAGSGSTTSASTSAPNLSGVPASWKVVAYNAVLGTGSGVGTVTVLNRSSGVFSGIVKVAYTRGGAAYASFSGLGPGQSEVLTLTGTPYSGGGYTILLPTVR
jgi:hypothetical protein